MTTWQRAAQPADDEDFSFRLGEHVADAIHTFALQNNLTPADIVEALPVMLVQLLGKAIRPGLPVADLLEDLLPFIREQATAVDFGKGRGSA